MPLLFRCKLLPHLFDPLLKRSLQTFVQRQASPEVALRLGLPALHQERQPAVGVG